MIFDGTLAKYNKWVAPDVIGEPIPRMVNRVKQMLTNGKDVRIFTARVWPLGTNLQDALEYKDRVNQAIIAFMAIQKWCEIQFGQTLPITCIKDYQCYVFYDDRAVQVIANTGQTISEYYGDCEGCFNGE